MGTADITDGKLVEFYHRYVGEPESKRDVYGYWIFLLGCLAAVVAAVIYFGGWLLFGDPFATRQTGIALAAIALPLGILGIVILLPVRRRALQASVVGLAISVVAIALFVRAYPSAWNVDSSPDYAPEVIAMYSAGLGLIAGVVVLVPIVTGEKGLLVEPELGLDADSPPVLTGEANGDAFYAVYEHPSKDWAWRVVERNAIGECAVLSSSDTDARLAIEDVRELIGDAGLLEITTSAFRVYRTEDDRWRWSLVRDDGSVLAESNEPHPTRDDAESTVNFLKEAASDANVVEIRSAAFDVYEDGGGRWRWRLIDDRRRPLAYDSEGFATEAAAEGATDRFLDRLGDARVLAIESVGIELYPDGDEWRWRLVDADDHHLVSSTATFDSRRSAESAATDVADRVTEATIVEYGTPGFEVYEMGREYRWRLRDDADELIARSESTAATESAGLELAERTRDAAAEAEIVEFSGADYEVYPDGDEWRWRLVASDRTVLADSTESFEEREAAEAAGDRVREQALAADLLEFEQAAFQQYESGGEWRWRLIDEDGQVMADSGEEYGSRDEVMEGMTTLKENAPDAEVLEIDTAAFEIYKTDRGEYAWRLIDETGQLVAEAADTSPSRAAARDAVEFIIEHLDTASVRPMEAAAFQLSVDDERDVWQWWLVDTDGTVLAVDDADHSTRDDVRAAIQDVQDAATDAEIDAVGPATVQIREGAGWHWRLIDVDRDPIATAERTYERRGDVLTDVNRFIDDATDVPVFELGDGIVWIDRTDNGWGWRLVDGDRRTIAVGAERHDEEAAATDAVDTVRTRAPEAGSFDIETLAYELYRDDDGWRWRLLDEDENVLAVSAFAYEVRDDIERSIAESRDLVGEASILEIDEAAFEFHERDGGWIWRLVDENGNALAESVEPHESRSAAREEMLSVKEHAPEGETVVTW